MDLSAADRKDFTHSRWKPLPCINTATSFYNEHHRAGNCNRFMANPAKWYFVEVTEEDAVPGDLYGAQNEMYIVDFWKGL